MTKEIPNIKEQFSQGPQGQAMPTAEELEAQKIEQVKYLENTLPYMRLQAEYNRLQMELTELDVLMGRISVKQVPGLLGLELMVREVNTNGFLSQWANGQKDAVDRQKKENELLEAEKKAKEEFGKLPKEEQDRILTQAKETMKDKGLLDAFEGLTDDQKVNIVMQTKANGGTE